MTTQPNGFKPITGEELYSQVLAQFADGYVMQLTTYTRYYVIESADDVRLRKGTCEFRNGRYGRTWYPFSMGGTPIIGMRFGRWVESDANATA